MTTVDPEAKAKRWKRRIGWYFVISGPFAALRELSLGRPIMDLASLMPMAVSAALIAWGWYWIVTNPRPGKTP